MYHIKNDKRSLASAGEICRGLTQCLKTTPLSDVTISDLNRVTGISRATFYRLFDTVEDVIIYRCDQMIEQIQDAQIHDTSAAPYDIIRNMMLKGFEYTDLLEALVKNRRFDLLYEYTARQICSFDSLRKLLGEDLTDTQTQYMLDNLAMSMVSTLSTWIRLGRKESAEDIFELSSRYWQTMSRIIEH